MNLHFRLLWLFFKRWLQQRKGSFDRSAFDPTQTCRLGFRVLPHDCDANLHLTSSRYFAMMDICRVDWLLSVCSWKLLIKERWKYVVNAQEITYIRELKPFARFEIKSRLLGWDEKYFYVEHRVVRHGRLHAIAHIRAACVKNGKVLNFGDVLETCGFAMEARELPEAIGLWQELLDHKKWVNKKPVSSE
ncbi:Uncharacterised protein [BD1-7 clade bacterium]|uniref:Thioesterase domain-containing protein n=1 Tax=BD1-7 clade bacterium TaxID=2029982 RepID=A0A5S9R179_9GAMM|nr:Uncharacterised protein [BD1-7 clade bacterium]